MAISQKNLKMMIYASIIVQQPAHYPQLDLTLEQDSTKSGSEREWCTPSELT